MWPATRPRNASRWSRGNVSGLKKTKIKRNAQMKKQTDKQTKTFLAQVQYFWSLRIKLTTLHVEFHSKIRDMNALSKRSHSHRALLLVMKNFIGSSFKKLKKYLDVGPIMIANFIFKLGRCNSLYPSTLQLQACPYDCVNKWVFV